MTETFSSQTYQLFIRAAPGEIWTALISPECTAQYFYGSHVDTSVAPGSPISYRSPGGEQLLADGRILESVIDRRLAHTWRALWDSEMEQEHASRVTWEIEPVGPDLCRVTLVHDQLERAPKTAREVADGGWALVLSGLKTLLETGKPLAS